MGVYPLYLRFSPLIKITVKGRSMYPRYKEGDILIVNKLAYLFGKPKIDDIVLLKSPVENRLLIKKISFKKDGKYFVIGENEKESIDSRNFGWVYRESILGKVIKLH